MQLRKESLKKSGFCICKAGMCNNVEYMYVHETKIIYLIRQH